MKRKGSWDDQIKTKSQHNTSGGEGLQLSYKTFGGVTQSKYDINRAFDSCRRVTDYGGSSDAAPGSFHKPSLAQPKE